MRQSYVVTEPSDVEGFKEQVLKSASTGAPLTITATRSQTEFMPRREGPAHPKLFELTAVVMIVLTPTLGVTLRWEKGQQDLFFEEIDGHVRFGIYAD